MSTSYWLNELQDFVLLQAFPCIATGIYGYPNDAAAEVALACTRDWLESNREKVDCT